MADDDKPNTKASRPSEGGSGTPPQSVLGANAPPREKPVIEGKARELAADERAQETLKPAVTAAAGVLPPSHGEDAAAEPAPAAVPADAGEPAPAPRSNLWPVAAAIVLGAAIAVGGAFGLHRLDHGRAAIARLETRVTALEHRPLPAPQQQPDVSGLEARIGALESAARTTHLELARLQQDAQQLKTAQDETAKKLAAPAEGPAAAAPDLAPVTARIGKLEEQLAALEGRVSALAQGLDSARAAQTAKDRASEAAAARADANAVAILAANLRRDVETGSPLAGDIAALTNQGFDKNRLAPLEAVAVSGVATPAALAKQFAALAPQILATAPTHHAQGFLGRLAEDAAHLVRIRRIGGSSGHDLAAQTARIEAALAKSDVELALREWNDLPAAAKEKSKAFADAVRQRLAAVAAAKTIEADALASLAKSKS